MLEFEACKHKKLASSAATGYIQAAQKISKWNSTANNFFT